MPSSEPQYTHRSCYISLFKCKSFDQSDPPERPQILDIFSVVIPLAFDRSPDFSTLDNVRPPTTCIFWKLAVRAT